MKLDSLHECWGRGARTTAGCEKEKGRIEQDPRRPGNLTSDSRVSVEEVSMGSVVPPCQRKR